jgi:ribosome-associated translation inhibitor RaiA
MAVPVQLTLRDVRRTDRLEQEIERRVATLARVFPRIERCRATIELPHKSRVAGNRYRVRLELAIPGEDIVVVEDPATAGDLRAAGEEAVSKADEAVDVEHRYLFVTLKDAFEAARRQLESRADRLQGEVKTHAH